MKTHWLALLFFIFISAGCGYHLEGTNPSLPSDAGSLAILPIQNQTFQAELETRLMRHLRRLLRNNSSVRIATPEEADLILVIQLKSLRTSQTSVAADGFTVELQLSLAGSVVLQDRDSEEPIWTESSMSAKGVLLYEQGEASKGVTVSTRGRGLDQVTSAFAQRVYERIFFRF